MLRFSKRRWGWYLVLLDYKQFKVKLLKFKKHLNCSMQYHHMRKELWLFLYGNGKFELGNTNEFVSSGDWREVDIATKHRFFALAPTLVLEIQYGTHCLEEDIIRVYSI